jgi:hypothetical protein
MGDLENQNCRTKRRPWVPSQRRVETAEVKVVWCERVEPSGGRRVSDRPWK